MNIGYACINMTLGSQKPKVTTNRGMIRKTFDEKGISYVSELALQNVRDLIEVIKWNEGLSEILVDLDFIKEKEGDVLLFQDSKDSVYADVHLKGLIDKLSDVIEDIIILTESDTEEDMDS